jgi:hypothetical protein
VIRTRPLPTIEAWSRADIASRRRMRWMWFGLIVVVAIARLLTL